MKNSKKILLAVPLVIVSAITIGLLVLFLIFPKVGPAPAITVDKSPERIERGRYLANHVAVCMDCHSTRDMSRFSGPLVRGTEGQGGERFDEAMGFPGTFISSNITPVALSNWTDGEILRAFTSGVSRDGRPLFPVMPYHYYGQMAEEDAHAIVAYVRTLEAKGEIQPKSQPKFPVSLILRTLPKNPNFRPRPAETDQLAYGEYLTRTAACVECHTPAEQGQIVAGKEFTGGREFRFPDGKLLRSPNLRPDSENGLGQWTKESFVARFKSYAKDDALVPVGPERVNTIMPWSMYAGMTETDLEAIFAYLKSLPPAR